MTQEDKELLFVDLSARIPYGVKCQKTEIWYSACQEIEKVGTVILKASNLEYDNYELYKPYLFPLTEEILDKATEESNNLYKELICSDSDLYIENNKSNILLLQAKIRSSVIKYFHIHHIDYNGLIEKGLAIDATNLNIY
jgi:hypothetical protein